MEGCKAKKLFVLPFTVALVCSANCLQNYTIAVVLETGVAASFDVQTAGPAVDLGKEIFKRTVGKYLNVQYVDRRIPTEPYICKKRGVGALAADLYHEQRINAIIGPGCSDSLEIIGFMAASWNIPIITPVGTAAALASKQDYPTLTRLGSDKAKYAEFLMTVFQHFNWTNIVIIRDVISTGMELIGTSFRSVWEKAGLKVTMVLYTSAYNHKGVLELASQVSRVFVILAYAQQIRELMLTAHEMGKTGGDYAFILAQSSPWTEEDEHNKNRWKMYESVLIPARMTTTTPLYEEFQHNISRLSEEHYNYTYGNKNVGIAVYRYYNCFSLFAEAMKTALDAGDDPFDGEKVMKAIWNRTYEGFNGRFAIDEFGNREDDFSLFDINSDGKLQEVAYLLGIEKILRMIPGSPIRWPNGGDPPINNPRCGFLEDSPKCDENSFPLVYTIVIIFGCILVCLGIFGVLFFRRLKSKTELHNMWWKVKWEDVMFISVSKNLSLGVVSSKQSHLVDNQSWITQVFAKVANYKGATVAIKMLNIKQIVIDGDVLSELKEMRDLNCSNLAKFHGLCPDEPTVCFLIEYCSRGSLKDILQNDSIKLDKQFKVSLLSDIVEGMLFIHNGHVKIHGRLHSSNCVIDGRFTLKITDFGLLAIRSQEDDIENANERHLLWIAPEHLRTNALKNVSQPGDAYSFAIVLYEILTRSRPFDDETCTLSISDIINTIKKGSTPPFRPVLDEALVERDIINLLKTCWNENPVVRPTFTQIKLRLKNAKWSVSAENFFDVLLRRMEQYANNLEGLVEERTQAFLDEKRKSEELLYHILPQSVADKLKNGRFVDPETYDSVTIYFSDIVGFTSICSESKPMEVVDLLNDLYTCFDDIIDGFDVYKVETIGDAYMVVSGLPARNGVQHAMEIARLSLSIIKNIVEFKIRHRPTEKLKARIGLHSGPVCAGVVGRKMPRYCLFGDTVNTASRMESSGEAMKIHISPSTQNLLDTFQCFRTEERGCIYVKGKGNMVTYWLIEEL